MKEKIKLKKNYSSKSFLAVQWSLGGSISSVISSVHSEFHSGAFFSRKTSRKSKWMSFHNSYVFLNFLFLKINLRNYLITCWIKRWSDAFAVLLRMPVIQHSGNQSSKNLFVNHIFECPSIFDREMCV